MGQVSNKLRRNDRGFVHFCPACNEPHTIYHGLWEFNNNLDKPTFAPSVKVSGVRRIMVAGKWSGKWLMDENDKPVKYICHYFLKDGMLDYQKDSTHQYAGQKIELPDLPEYLRDHQWPTKAK